MATASEFVNVAKKFLGTKESDEKHKEIINIYNSIKPLPVGYKIGMNDSWCAAFVSACAKEAGLKKFPFECSCERMITRAKAQMIWEENDAHIPAPGDVIMYDWQDNGKGDNKGWADHTGIVEKVTDGKITVIEGNFNNAVKRRNISVDGRYIRGYIKPPFEKENVYFPAYNGLKTYSIVDALNALGINSTYTYRAKIAAKNGIKLYCGTAKQNLAMLELLKKGKLIQP